MYICIYIYVCTLYSASFPLLQPSQILLSNQTVGCVPTLPVRLLSEDVERIISEAQKDVGRIQDEIATQMANLPGSKSVQLTPSKNAVERVS